MSLGINAIRAIVDAGASSLFRSLKQEWFVDEEEAELYGFVAGHVRRYATLPSSQTLRENGFSTKPVTQPPQYFVDKLAARAVFVAVNEAHAPLSDAMRSRDPQQIRDCLSSMLLAARRVSYQQDYSTLVEQSSLVAEDYEVAKNSPGVQGITLGNPFLDEVTNGAVSGDVIAIAGRPNIGKSWKMLSMARAAWMESKSVAIVSMEMTARQLARRFIGLHSGLNPDLIRKGQLSSGYGEGAFYSTIRDIPNKPPIYFLEGSFRRKVADVDNLVQMFSPDILYIDAAYLLSPSSVVRNASVRDIKTSALEEIKTLAVDRNIPVGITWQLNRDAKRNAKKGLDLTHIAETDALGQIASIVIGMQKGKVPLEDSTREYQIIKNRDGKLSQYLCRFEFNPMDFRFISGGELEDDAVADGEDSDDTVSGWEV